MADFSVFNSLIYSAFVESVPDAFYAKFATVYNQQIRYNYTQNNVISMSGATGESVALNITYSTDPSFILLRVIGDISLDVAGFDADGTTPITATLKSYGNTILPGLLLLNGYNITTLTLNYVADSVVELFICKTLED